MAEQTVAEGLEPGVAEEVILMDTPGGILRLMVGEKVVPVPVAIW